VKRRPLDNYRVLLTLTDGRVVEIDLGTIVGGPVFARSGTTMHDLGSCVWKAALSFGLPAPTCAPTSLIGCLPPADAASDAV